MREEQVKEIVIRALQLSSETSSVEFKDARGGFPKDTWKTISSFSHRPGGGYIVFGIKEDRSEGKTKFSIVGMRNGAFVRDGNADRKITDEEMRRFLDNAKLSKFDASRAPDTSLDDLST